MNTHLDWRPGTDRPVRLIVGHLRRRFLGLSLWPKVLLAVVVALGSAAAAEDKPVRLDRTNLLQYRDASGQVRPVQTPADWQERRTEILRGMQEVMGPLPSEERRVPLAMEIEEETDLGNYVRRLITYQSEPASRTTAYLCIPDDVFAGERTAPAVLCLHPTDNTVGHRVALGLGGRPGREYAAELAERGYVTLAPSYPHLADYWPNLGGLGYVSGTMKAIWDNSRGLDLLASLPYVDDARGFGAIGHSLGGHNAIYTAVLDTRITVLASSCGFDSFLHYYNGEERVWYFGKGWCQIRYMPRLSNYRNKLEDIPFDFHELLGALAPRPFFVNAPLHDSNFQWKSVDECARAAEPVYELLGGQGRLDIRHPDCGHDFPVKMRQAAYELIDGVLCPNGKAEEKKLVLAHYMTDMVPQTNQPLNRWIDPELADPMGSTAALGGLNQTVPMASLYLQKADLTAAVEFEIRAARQLGIDGFQFYYPLGDNTRVLAKAYNQIIHEFIRLSDARFRGFKISLCLSHPQTRQPSTESQRIALWVPSIRALVEETRDSPAWLRSDSGALLFYLWVGDALADGVQGRANTPAEIREVGRAYQRLSQAVGTPIEYIYQVRRPTIDPPYIQSIVRTFPAVWGWTASDEDLEFWDYLSKRCREEGCVYTQTVYPDYYTSKVYGKGDTGHTILSTDQALQVGLGAIERHYRVTNLAQTQIQLLQRAVDQDAAIINYVTWNDFPEGHHLAPEINHNFGPALLLKHFKQRWKSGNSNVERDEAIVFFKKYRHDAQPKYAVHLKIKSKNQDLAGEDRIELVTLLTEPASCFLNDQALGLINPGLQVRSIPSEPGPVRVRVVRRGQQIIHFETPVGVDDAPLRTDRLTYSYSSAFEREFTKLFEATDQRR